MLNTRTSSTTPGSTRRRWSRAIRSGYPVGVIALGVLLLHPSAGLAESDTEDLIALPSAPNAQIKELARQVRMTPGGTKGKLDRIIDQIFDQKEGLGFTYKARPTLTAAQAIEAREGNCLSLVNLAVSIARSAGIDAEYVEVEDFEAFYRMKGTIVRTTHVIGGVNISGTMMYIDFLPRRPKPYRRLQPISDRRAAALFFNALATEAILEGDFPLAETHFRNALNVDDDAAETWNNYAVLQRRQGDLEAAVASLERSHRLDRHLLPAIENLVGIYRRSGQYNKATEFERLALEEKTKNPYFLLQQALESLNKEDYSQAEGLLKRARRLEPDEAEIYVALGRVAIGKGNTKEANKLFEQARRKSAPRTSGFQMLLERKIERLMAASEESESAAEDS